jgi:hypothetical protein
MLNLLRVDSVLTLSLSYCGLAFDTTAILYVNVLFIVFSYIRYGETLIKIS